MLWEMFHCGNQTSNSSVVGNGQSGISHADRAEKTGLLYHEVDEIWECLSYLSTFSLNILSDLP